MDDLHARVLAAIEAREGIAKRAVGPRWISNGTWEIRTPPSGSELRNLDGPDWYQVVVAPEMVGQDIMDFKRTLSNTVDQIVANDPRKTIRHCARDRRVLERHCLDDFGYCFWCSEDGYHPINVAYPCVELRDLAEAYEVEL